jgi:hypothetical protein
MDATGYGNKFEEKGRHSPVGNRHFRKYTAVNLPSLPENQLADNKKRCVYLKNDKDFPSPRGLRSGRIVVEEQHGDAT